MYSNTIERVPVTIYKCPNCRHMRALRVQRASWMRLLPNSMRLECTQCSRLYLGFRQFEMRYTTRNPERIEPPFSAMPEPSREAEAHNEAVTP